LRDLSSADFPRSPEAIAWGEEAAIGHLAKLKMLGLPAADYAAYESGRAIASTGRPQIKQINVGHDSIDTQKTVAAVLGWQEGQPLDIERLETGITEIYSDGRHSKIQYEVVPNGDITDLDINLTDKSWGPTVVEAALRVSDNFDGDSNFLLSVETLTSHVNSRGGKWINRARMGIRTGIFSEFYQPLSANHRNFIAPSVEYTARNVNVTSTTDQTIWRDQRGIFAIDVGHAFGNHAEIRLGYEVGHADTRIIVGDTIIDSATNFTISDANSPAYFLDIYKPVSVGRGTFLFGLSANGATDDDLIFQEILSLGGITRLSGYQPDELFGRYTGLASIGYYRRMGSDKDSLLGTPVYIGGSIEAGGVWFTRDDISTDSLQMAGSIFAGIDSPIGPIYFAYGHAEGGVNSIYLNVGSLFRRLPRR